MKKKIDTREFNEEQRGAFVDGWREAGGYTGDYEAEAPWSCPWDYNYVIEVEGDDVKDWGAQYWAECKDEVEALLKEDECDDKSIYVFDATAGMENIKVTRETKDWFMYARAQWDNLSYEAWARGGYHVSGFFDCEDEEDALDYLQERLDDEEITQDQYDALTAQVKAM